MFDETAAEEAVAERVRKCLSAAPALPCDVRKHPGELPQVALAAHAEIVVKYEGSNWADPIPDPRGGATQDRRPRIALTTRYRNLQARDGHAGVNEYLRRLRAGLTGWSMPDVPEVSAMHPVSERLLWEVDGVWVYETVFALKFTEMYTLAAEETEEEEGA